jgi:hypothetical protein
VATLATLELFYHRLDYVYKLLVMGIYGISLDISGCTGISQIVPMAGVDKFFRIKVERTSCTRRAKKILGSVSLTA